MINRNGQSLISKKRRRVIHPTLKAKALKVCEDKIVQKGETMSLSFYANKMTGSSLLFEMANG